MTPTLKIVKSVKDGLKTFEITDTDLPRNRGTVRQVGPDHWRIYILRGGAFPFPAQSNYDWISGRLSDALREAIRMMWDLDEDLGEEPGDDHDLWLEIRNARPYLRPVPIPAS